MGFVIREATLGDDVALTDYVARLFEECLPGIYRRNIPSFDEEREFIRSYDAANSVLLVAELDGQVIGLVGLMERALPQESHVAALGISVDRDHRGRGTGNALIEEACRRAADRGIRCIEVEAFANNPDAIRLYERLGFLREGVRRQAVLVDGECADVAMLARSPVAQQADRADNTPQDRNPRRPD